MTFENLESLARNNVIIKNIRMILNSEHKNEKKTVSREDSENDLKRKEKYLTVLRSRFN
jgi:hypothetical protein